MSQSEKLPAYPLILDIEDEKYLTVFAKMYQLYYSLEHVEIVYSSITGNHYVEITENDLSTSFSWFEFVLFEITGLINSIITETTGIYKKHSDPKDLLIKLDFEALWEHLDDWVSDLSITDFEEDPSGSNIDYVYKMFKCTEHYVDTMKTMPDDFSDNYINLVVAIDEYFAEHLDIQISSGTLPAIIDGESDFKKEEDEYHNTVPVEELEEEIEEQDESDKIIVTLKTKTFVEHGIYKT